MSVKFGLILIGLLIIVALFVALKPLRLNLFKTGLIGLIFTMVAGLLYCHWGAFEAVSQFQKQLLLQKQAQAFLKTIHSKQELIDKLESRLKRNPTARGWYLLGRLYMSEQQVTNAKGAFAKAYELAPHDEQITMNYIQSLWQSNERKFNRMIRRLLFSVLRQNENQPDALAMLAMDSYLRHADADAISYWQKLSSIVPMESEDAQAIRKAISKAEKRLAERNLAQKDVKTKDK